MGPLQKPGRVDLGHHRGARPKACFRGRAVSGGAIWACGAVASVALAASNPVDGLTTARAKVRGLLNQDRHDDDKRLILHDVCEKRQSVANYLTYIRSGAFGFCRLCIDRKPFMPLQCLAQQLCGLLAEHRPYLGQYLSLAQSGKLSRCASFLPINQEAAQLCREMGRSDGGRWLPKLACQLAIGRKIVEQCFDAYLSFLHHPASDLG